MKTGPSPFLSLFCDSDSIQTKMSTYNKPHSQKSHHSDPRSQLATEYIIEDAGHTPYRSEPPFPLPTRTPASPGDQVQHTALRDILELDAHTRDDGGQTPTQLTFSEGPSGYAGSVSGSDAYYPCVSEYSYSSTQQNRNDRRDDTPRSGYQGTLPAAHCPQPSSTESVHSVSTSKTQSTTSSDRTYRATDTPTSTHRPHAPPSSTGHTLSSSTSKNRSSSRSSISSDFTRSTITYGHETTEAPSTPPGVSTTRSGASRSASAPSSASVKSSASSASSVKVPDSQARYPDTGRATNALASSISNKTSSRTSNPKAIDPQRKHARHPERATSLSSSTSNKATTTSSGRVAESNSQRPQEKVSSVLSSSTSGRTPTGIRSGSHDQARAQADAPSKSTTNKSHSTASSSSASTPSRPTDQRPPNRHPTREVNPVSSDDSRSIVHPTSQGRADVHVGDVGTFVPAGYKSLTVKTKDGGYVRVENVDVDSSSFDTADLRRALPPALTQNIIQESLTFSKNLNQSITAHPSSRKYTTHASQAVPGTTVTTVKAAGRAHVEVATAGTVLLNTGEVAVKAYDAGKAVAGGARIEEVEDAGKRDGMARKEERRR